MIEPLSGIGEGAASALALRLGEGRLASNAVFAEVGSRLQGCGSILDGIVAAFEALPRELQGSELADAASGLAGLGAEALALTAAFGRERDSTARLDRRVAAVSASVADLEKTARLLGILALNAHVVAADSGASANGLATIAGEATRLAENADARIATFRHVYRRLVDEVRDAAVQQEAFDARHRRTLSDVGERIGAHLAALEAHRQRSAAGLAETGAASREVSQGVCRAVMALQIGDATHQRMEHVEAALRTALDGTADSAVLALQQTLLADAAERLDAETGALGQALASLVGQAEAIVDQGRSTYGAGESDSSLLAELSAEVQRAAGVLRAYERERRKLDLMAAGVTSTVGDLLQEVEAVRRIERNMRMLSLNATASCAREGLETRGFDVIAQQLREITTRLVECADSAMSGLAAASNLAAELLESASSAGAERVEQMLADAGGAIDLLSGVETRLDAALRALGRDGPKAASELRVAARTLAETSALSALLREAEAATERMGEGLSAPNPSLAPDLFARLRKLYTMASERQLHDAFAGAAPSAAPEAATVPEADEFELF